MNKIIIILSVILFSCNNGDIGERSTFYVFSDSTISLVNNPNKTLIHTVTKATYHTGSLIDSFYVYIDSSFSKAPSNSVDWINKVFWYTDSTITIK